MDGDDVAGGQLLARVTLGGRCDDPVKQHDLHDTSPAGTT